nr:facilitated trehalose transporter Tret1-like isoform X3 [Dermatophagoides farinae]XP_046909424.1 facilitated trehalose transporter Tret1-like isoform X3 [Dermatophagoides farinae]XP_046909425.1 facilitated trehalose transporter Tret1-like isoform X3 [Dermatophagoides farinae]
MTTSTDDNNHRNNKRKIASMDSESNRPRIKQQPSLTLYLAAVSALLGALGMGLVLGWTAPALITMAEDGSEPKLDDKTDKDAITWIGSSMTLGALCGALFSGTISQFFGRKKALIIYGIPFTIGWVLLVLAKNVTLLIVGRVVCGISCGLLSGTAPSYVVEISTIDIRGMIGACFQLFVTIGILLVYLFGAFITWRPLAGVSMIPTIIMMICMFFMPESPSWLMSKGKVSEATQSLRRLRGSNSDTEQEIRMLQQAEIDKQGDEFKFSSYSRRPHLMPFILSLLLMLFQQFSGINAVMFYATSIFSEAGSSIEPKYATIIIGVSQVIATGVGSSLVDRLGRKILLGSSALLHVISLAALGVYYYLADKHPDTAKSLGWLPLVSLVVFIIGFSIGFGPVPWLMVAEITPTDSRAMTSAIATAFNWTCAFLITKNFELLKDTFTTEGTFFSFAAMAIVSIIFVVCMLPETKGKSSEEIAKNFKSSSSSSSNHRSNNKVELDRLN